jgi:adenylylsulfate kinase
LSSIDKVLRSSPAVAGTASGTVYWITGLSGSGKTTVSQLLVTRFRSMGRHVIMLDGDELREVFGHSFGYSAEDRARLAMVYSRLCRSLAVQGFDVIIATVAMFSTVRDWNRNNIEQYREIYLTVPIELLAERDPKGLYARARRGEVQNVVGVDLPVDAPRNPDLVIENFGACTPEIAVQRILQSCR